MRRRQRTAFVLAAALLALAAACSEKTYEFDDVAIGDDDTRAPRPRTNGQWLRAVYADLLGRNTEQYDFVVEDGAGTQLAAFPIDEEALLLGILDNLGDPDPMRAIMVAGLAASDEAALPDKDDVSDPGAFIDEKFRAFLGRDPSPYERAAFLVEWENDPAVNPRTLVRALIASREYQSF